MRGEILIISFICFLNSCSNTENEYDKNGSLVSSIDFIETKAGNRIYHGKLVIYTKEGVERVIAEYKNNRLHNIYTYKSTQGDDLKFGDFKNGNGFLKVYDEFGSLRETGQMINGVPDGYWKMYSKDALIIDSIYYQKGYLSNFNGFPETIYLK